MNNVFTIEKLFADRVFAVPDYQRGYAWEEQQLTEFVEDLESLPPGKDHYTGTLVLHDRRGEDATCIDEAGERYTVSDVVDGQQRLTTIVLLLDAVRREMAGIVSMAKLAEGLSNRYVRATDQAGLPLYKLVLNRDCRDYFAQTVLGDRPSPDGASIQSHRRLSGARKFFADYLATQREALRDGYAEWLKSLRTKVVQHLKVTLYTVEDQAEVGVIFEVLNNRGKPLSELEKVKNYLLYLSTKLDLPKHTLGEEVNRAWTHVFERLMRAGMTSADAEDQLLRSHWLMAYDHRPKHWEGSRSVKARFSLKREEYQSEHKALLADLINYARTLEQASLAFCDVHRPEATDAFAAWETEPVVRKQVVAASEKLRRIKVVAPFLPLLVAARLQYPTDAARYLELVRLCEVFAFRVYRLHGYRANAGQSSLFKHGNRLYGKEMDLDKVLPHLRGLLLWYSSPEYFRSEFEPDEKKSDWYDWYGIRYFLYEYEEHLCKGEAPRLAWDVLDRLDLERTIEHVLPQTPTDAYWTGRFDAVARQRWTHDVGNLCLTAHNASLSNKPFPQKKGAPGQPKPCYANSNLASERALAANADWGVAELLARREAIVEWALERWHVEGAAEADPQEDDDAGE
ncbi:MAG: DUF262 domain-containing protein [Planctomycetes bacterium]|nr:DUF262 domain-containing protein [Planctomycetota bacterium]